MDFSISEFGQIHCCKQEFKSKTNNRMANHVDPDEMDHNKPSHLNLQRYLYWSAGIKGTK